MLFLSKHKVFVIRTNPDNKLHAVRAATSKHAMQHLTYKKSNFLGRKYYSNEIELV